MFALENVAQAYTTVQLCDRNVENVISDLSKTVKNFGVTLWGKEYYTYKGERRCQLHFGNSKTNVVRFRVNNDNSVVWAFVSATLQIGQSDEEKDYIRTQTVMTAISLTDCIGLSESDSDSLRDKLQELATKWRDGISKSDPPHGQVSLWCPSVQRYVLLDIKIDDLSDDEYSLDFTFSAYK